MAGKTATRRTARNPRPKPQHEPGWRLVAFNWGWLKHDKAGRWTLRLFAWERQSDTRVQRRKARHDRAEAAGKARTARAMKKAADQAAARKAVDARLSQQRADAQRTRETPLEPTRILRSVPAMTNGEHHLATHVQSMKQAGLCGHPNVTGGYCRNVVRNNPCPAHGTMPRSGGSAS